MKSALADLSARPSYTLSSSMKGTILFVQHGPHDAVSVSFDLEGFPPGVHGMHVHEKALTEEMVVEKEDRCCDELGPHFNSDLPIWDPISNPDGTKHGEHAGDLNFNILVDREGRAKATFIDTKISLVPSHKNCILGRSLVIHDKADDRGVRGTKIFTSAEEETQSYKTGNAGKRIACTNITST